MRASESNADLLRTHHFPLSPLQCKCCGGDGAGRALTGQVAEGDEDEDGGEDHQDEVELDALGLRQRQRVVPRDQPRACVPPATRLKKSASIRASVITESNLAAALTISARLLHNPI